MSKRSISPYERYGAARPFSDAVIRIHVFTATDTISDVVEKYYGDWRKWRIIAERNNLTDVRQIEIGTELIIPKLSLNRGIYESS